MQAFVPDIAIIAAFGLAALVLAITPGPDMALFISRTINYGVKHGFATVAGATAGIVIHTSLAAFGISVLIVAAPTAFWVLKIAGALYLLYLAIQTIRHGSSLSLPTAQRRPTTLRQSFLTGLGINLTNPKIVLFFVTFLPQFVERTDPAASAKLVFLGVEFLLVSLPVVIATVLGARAITGALARSHWIERALNWSFATVFAAFAVTILLAEGRR